MSYEIPPDVAWVYGQDVIASDTAVYAMKVPDGSPVVLDSTAALIWLVVADGTSDPASTIADLTGEEPTAIGADVARYLDDLISRGLLCLRSEEDR